MARAAPASALSPGGHSARRRVLFIGGSLNQTTMLHRVARELYEHECAFSPFYADGLLRFLAERGRLDFTTLGGRAKRLTEAYLIEQDLRVDARGEKGPYDLVVMGTDLVVPRNVRGRPLVLVQEGMTDPEDWRYHLVRTLGLPRFLANTSMTGLSGAYAAFCVASPGYRDLFVGKGAPADRIVVTGIPNFDDAASFAGNDFPHRGYVLGVTSCLRETLKPEDRPGFIRRCVAVAGGRELLFKLHPNEDWERARREILELAPHAVVFAEGNTNHMVANADVVVTTYSSVVYVALALQKEVHADLDLATLRALLPIQNGGTSARRIADVCRGLLG
jgi:hypothetical protein